MCSVQINLLISGEPGLEDRVLALLATGGTCPNDFSDLIDQDIHTQ